MNNIKINGAETIFEPFWDSGESYPEHFKYSRLTPYKIIADKNSLAEPMWSGIRIIVGANETLTIRRKCDLDITDYDIFRMFAIVASSITVKISCKIDDEFKAVLTKQGKGSAGEYDGAINGKRIKEIELTFINNTQTTAQGNLSWLGLSNSVLQEKMENEKSRFSSEWEGCFRDEEIKFEPTIGIFFDNEGLREIREKVKKEPFLSIFNELKKRAQSHMHDEPEESIGEYVPYINPVYVRDRDKSRVEYCKFMEDIAFVGLIENDPDMLRMACRMALSLSCCTNWCEGVMGAFPGTTWHHRSFTEERIGVGCMKVLDWAGSVLTWHGCNIIYDAIIMKALPRLDADVKTMDYIWDMNQGVFFAGGLVTILIGLSKRYPRYNSRLDEAEKDLISIWGNYVAADGGCAEGPSYWMDSFRSMIINMYMLARYRGKSLKEYLPEIIKKSEDFAICMLSDINDGFSFLPINDTSGFGSYHPLVPAFFMQISDNPLWRNMLKTKLLTPNLPYGAELIIISDEAEESENKVFDSHFLTLNNVGHTMIRRKTEEAGKVHMHVIGGGLVTFGHSHSDKGSVILEADGIPLLIDCGVCSYADSRVKQFAEPQKHNLLMPDIPEENQLVVGTGAVGKILCSEYSDGVFKYSTDLTDAWRKEIFKKNIRSITSDNPLVFEICDDVEYYEERACVFVLNTYGEISEEDSRFCISYKGISVMVTTKNWIPEKVVTETGTDGRGEKVNRLLIYTSKAKAHNLITHLEVEGRNKQVKKGAKK